MKWISCNANRNYYEAKKTSFALCRPPIFQLPKFYLAAMHMFCQGTPYFNLVLTSVKRAEWECWGPVYDYPQIWNEIYADLLDFVFDITFSHVCMAKKYLQVQPTCKQFCNINVKMCFKTTQPDKLDCVVPGLWSPSSRFWLGNIKRARFIKVRLFSLKALKLFKISKFSTHFMKWNFIENYENFHNFPNFQWEEEN